MLEVNERREYTRLQTNCRMTFRLADSEQAYSATCLNLSAAGLLFESSCNLDLGQILEGTIYPGNDVTPPMTAFIEVIRSTRSSEQDTYLLAGSIKGLRG